MRYGLAYRTSRADWSRAAERQPGAQPAEPEEQSQAGQAQHFVHGLLPRPLQVVNLVEAIDPIGVAAALLQVLSLFQSNVITAPVSVVATLSAMRTMWPYRAVLVVNASASRRLMSSSAGARAGWSVAGSSCTQPVPVRTIRCGPRIVAQYLTSRQPGSGRTSIGPSSG